MEELVGTPGMTAVRDPEEAWRLHVDEALVALPLVIGDTLVDVGSGGGSPGIPLAVARPDVTVDLLEASRRKCDALERWVSGIPNVRVVCARAEDWGRGEGRDRYAVAVARALAPQPVAAEWCLPLVRPGGIAVLYAGLPEAGLEAVARALGAEGPETHEVPGRAGQRLLVFRKVLPTPDRFPRRPGAARKRPLDAGG